MQIKAECFSRLLREEGYEFLVTGVFTIGRMVWGYLLLALVMAFCEQLN